MIKKITGWEWSGTVLMALLLAVLSFASLFAGVTGITMDALFSGQDEMALKIFLLARIPRLLAILCTGTGMSIAGLIMQQLCMNRFVSPTTGATISSAQLGILLSLIFIPGAGLWGRTLSAFLTAVGGTWIFVGFIRRIPFRSAVLVPLVGIMFGNVIGGVTGFLSYRFEMTQQMSSFLIGSFAPVISGNYELVWLAAPLVVLAFIYADHFNIAGMGEGFAANLGVNYRFILFAGLTISAMITAAVVTVVGSISYIGLLVPNIVTLFRGDRLRGCLADTALFGSLFVLSADLIARTVIMPYELPIELIVGMGGSILFIGLLAYRLKYGRKSIRFARKEAVSCD